MFLLSFLHRNPSSSILPVSPLIPPSQSFFLHCTLCERTCERTLGLFLHRSPCSSHSSLTFLRVPPLIPPSQSFFLHSSCSSSHSSIAVLLISFLPHIPSSSIALLAPLMAQASECWYAPAFCESTLGCLFFLVILYGGAILAPLIAQAFECWYTEYKTQKRLRQLTSRALRMWRNKVST